MNEITLKVVEPHFELITTPEQMQGMMQTLEQCGRTCYKSEDKITDTSANPFIKGIIKRGHESVIEHCVITGRFVGSRSMSHQLVRHRLSSFSQESQRYCDYGKTENQLQIIVPPSIGEIIPGVFHAVTDLPQPAWTNGVEIYRMTDTLEKILVFTYLSQCAAAYNTYLIMREHGIPAEDARELLPNATKTEVCTTFNLRMWRHFFKERALNKHAQWQIKKIARQALKIFAKELPVIFGDQQERVLAMEAEGK